MSSAVCTQLYNYLAPPFISYRLYLAFKVGLSISAPVNGGMSDWFTRAQILKLDIADISEDYTNSIVFLNFELSAALLLPVEA